MAILASANWYVRAGGNALNGGGYDAAISGAGTNYCDQDAAQLSLTDLATSGAGSTTLTSATGGFTAAMIGNCIRISAGTNFQTGYYFVTGRTDTNTVTLDRTPTSGGAGSGGTGRLGGAFASLSGSLSTGGTVTAPTITSPLAAGHTINIRGGGTDTPGSADYTQTGYAQYPAGDASNGPIQLVGYNGRPRMEGDLMFLFMVRWKFRHLLLRVNGGSWPDSGLVNCTLTSLHDVRLDQAGYDYRLASGGTLYNCELVNSGSTSAGTRPGWLVDGPASAHGTLFNGLRGVGISAAGNEYGVIESCVIANCHGTGAAVTIGSSTNFLAVLNNTIYGNAGTGLRLTSADGVRVVIAANNLLIGNGGYGIDVASGSAALNDRAATLIDYNAFRSNTSGAVNGISPGAHDITLTADPFTNAAGGDFTLNGTAGGGADLKGVAFPTSIP